MIIHHQLIDLLYVFIMMMLPIVQGFHLISACPRVYQLRLAREVKLSFQHLRRQQQQTQQLSFSASSADSHSAWDQEKDSSRKSRAFNLRLSSSSSSRREADRSVDRHPPRPTSDSSEKRRASTLLTSGEHRDFIQKVFKKRQYKQMMREETDQVIQDNYAKKNIFNYRDNYKSIKRQRKEQRGLTAESPSTESTDDPATTVTSSTPTTKTTTTAVHRQNDEEKKQTGTAIARPSTVQKPSSTASEASSTSKSSSSPTTKPPSSEQKLYTVMKSPPPFPATNSQFEEIPDRPFTLPPGKFRPKQSLGQNYLSDQNYVNKIISAFHLERLQVAGQKEDITGKQVIEIGPGIGAITRTLFPLYPDMLAVEIDSRAVEVLQEKLPKLKVQQGDILQFQYEKYAAEVLQGKKISIIANLPYHIVSQVLFSLADAHKAIDLATVTTQLEVAERITAKPNHKDYGIPSVVLQLYGATRFNFKIPPTVFYPVPKVDSALITIDFTKPHKELERVDKLSLRKVISMAFQQRRKMLRKSLKDLLERDNLTLPLKWQERRPESLSPVEFIYLTIDLYGEKKASIPSSNTGRSSDDYVWRNVPLQ